jgi:glucose-6-phosphate isomerase
MPESIKLDHSRMMEVDKNLLQHMRSMQDRINSAVKGVEDKRKRKQLGFYELPYQKAEKKEVKRIAARVRESFENFVVVGIGGSALGNKFLHSALNHPYHNILTRKERKGAPRVFILDSIDPDGLKGLMDVLDLGKTVFNVITKSGSTSETMANYLIIRDRLEKNLGKDRVKQHIIATTDRNRGSLLKIAREEGYQTLYIPENVGGRYSVLSPVGLLSASASGIDIDQLLSGAAHMEAMCKGTDPFENPALLGAVFQYLAYRKNRLISVVMPYSDALDDFGDWYCQLWAESLGKTLEIDGNKIPAGQTPIRAIGVRDQHSLLQLFLDGPDDKVFTLIKVENRDNSFEIPVTGKLDRGIDYLAGKALEKLLHSEFEATESVLTNRNRMNYKVIMPDISAHSIGQLIFLYMLMTAYMGEFLGINAYDQPAVEEGKRITYRLMGREGY